MRRNPALRKAEEPEEQERYKPLPRYEGVVPHHWIHIPTDVVLDAVLADGKTKRVLALMDFTMDSKGQMKPLVFEKYIRKGKTGGYDVWEMPFKNEPGMGWVVINFRNMADLITSPRSVVGMALLSRPRSSLYYVPGPIPADLPEPETPAQVRARLKRQYEEALERENQILSQAEAAIKRLGKKNPLEVSRFTPRAIGRATVLRTRRFNQHWGVVHLARLWESDKGNYAVWSDDANLFSTSPEMKVFGLRFYAHYPSALEDFLTRRTVGREAGGR